MHQGDSIKAILVGIRWKGGESYSILRADWHTKDIGKIVNLKGTGNYSTNAHCIHSSLTILTLIRSNWMLSKAIGNITRAIWKMTWSKDTEFGFCRMERSMMVILNRIWWMGQAFFMAKRRQYKGGGKTIFCLWFLRSIDILQFIFVHSINILDLL